MNQLQIFNNNDFGEVRTVLVDGEPYLVGRDVATILGYQNGSRDINRHVDDEDRTKIMVFDGNQDKETIVINESGLHSLILSSKMPNAKKFKRWVTSEVLPAIRKHGVYMTPETLEAAILNPDTIIKIATALKEEQEKNKKLETENLQQKQMLAEYSPKASYCDVVLQTPDAISASKIAKDYGKSAIWLNKILHENKIQYKQGGVWLLYQKYAEQGYTKSKTEIYNGSDGKQHSRIHTYWTQKGRLFIYDLLKSLGIYPLIEQDNIA